MALRLTCAVLVAAAPLGGCGDDAAPPSTQGGAAAGPRAIVTGLATPWSIAFLPGGDALVSERDKARILRVTPGGHKRVVMKVPGVAPGGEGGLLGLAVSPHYRRDRLVYAYFTSATDNRIVRFRLGGKPHAVLTGLRKGFIHNGGRIAFGPDGKLYAGVGETGNGSYAQDRSSQNGKILRMNPNGSVPRDNPFSRSRVWTYGHRNVQGLAWDRSGRLWESELGQDTFDEVNLIRKGRNYGWPVVEGRGSTHGGRFTNPKVTWHTAEASPSGAAIARGTLYIGALRGERLLRVRLTGTHARKLSPLLVGRHGRIRAVVRAPDGSIWVSTSNRDGRGSPRPGDDRILRLGV